jgi:hypothetical protein
MLMGAVPAAPGAAAFKTNDIRTDQLKDGGLGALIDGVAAPPVTSNSGHLKCVLVDSNIVGLICARLRTVAGNGDVHRMVNDERRARERAGKDPVTASPDFAEMSSRRRACRLVGRCVLSKAVVRYVCRAALSADPSKLDGALIDSRRIRLVGRCVRSGSRDGYVDGVVQGNGRVDQASRKNAVAPASDLRRVAGRRGGLRSFERGISGGCHVPVAAVAADAGDEDGGLFCVEPVHLMSRGRRVFCRDGQIGGAELRFGLTGDGAESGAVAAIAGELRTSAARECVE